MALFIALGSASTWAERPPLAAVRCAAPGQPAKLDARESFKAANRLYAQGRYAEALDEFQKALLAEPLPAFYYNIAKCYDHLGRYGEAMEAYQAYLDSGASEGAAVARGRLAELRLREEIGKLPETIEAEATPVTPALPLSASEAKPPGMPSRRARWIWPVVGGGAAAVVAAVVTVIVVTATATDYAQAARARCPGCPVFP